MKRSFQVATVFTGAVACATTLAPTADATTVTPDVTAGNCAVNSGPAAHLYYSANAKHPLAACLNGSGYISFPGGKKFAGICGGEYSGVFYYGVPGTSISEASNFASGYWEVRWPQPDIIYGVRLVRRPYVQGFTSCGNYGSLSAKQRQPHFNS